MLLWIGSIIMKFDGCQVLTGPVFSGDDFER